MVQVFGTRHLSPAGAWHVRAFLDRVKPTLVQIEGLSDANELIEHICDRRTRPPVAILAYTQAVPIRTIVYPLARYSPEYQAMAWALEHDVEVELIDLPSDIFLGLLVREHDAEPETTADDPPRKSTYDAIAERFGEPSYTSYWERHFEHNLADDSYRSAALELGRGLRELEAGKPRDFAENLVREAFMRRQVERAIARGHAPDKIAVLVGAFHAPVIDTALPAMTDAELEKLPRAETKLTLMPYSYFRLSSQSGYGAGNHAPAYFEMLWDAMQAGEMDHLAANYLSQIVRRLRKGGTSRSTAEVIEGVRLARTLSALHSGQAPTLLDLQDAARTLIGHGQASVIGDARARVEVGTEIGELPPGVSQTSIQLDFAEQLRRLKLEKYKTTVKAELALDLRENRRAKSEDAAFLDLNRSFFLHRLAVLNVSFAKPVRLDDRGASYKEMWQLQWTPESEIELVEAVLLGETVDLAASYAFKQRLESCGNAADAARIVRQACDCGMPKTADAARATVQALAATTSDFVTIAEAAAELARVIRYGDVRQFDREPLMPLVSELFVQGVLALPQAAKCDNQSAGGVRDALSDLDRVAVENDELVDEELYLSELSALSAADDLNPLLSGYACALLLERNLIDTAELSREVSRRLSPGIDADLGAGWFEGLASRNRYVLLSRLGLWQRLADYVASLDGEEFRRALVFLRRAFGSFSIPEKRTITENLAECWGVGKDELSQELERPLTEAEETKLEELGDFDFDDL